MNTSWLVMVLLFQVASKPAAHTKTVNYEGSAFAWRYDCGGLQAERWTADKGWHAADCMEIASAVGGLRDFRNVLVVATPDVAEMLTYEQYGRNFLISKKDFAKAQSSCRTLLSEKLAAREILAQCRETVAGKVPYGLKLADR